MESTPALTYNEKVDISELEDTMDPEEFKRLEKVNRADHIPQWAHKEGPVVYMIPGIDRGFHAPKESFAEFGEVVTGFDIDVNEDVFCKPFWWHETVHMLDIHRSDLYVTRHKTSYK